MSRQGAAATRATKDATNLLSRVRDQGLLVASTEDYGREEQAKLDAAEAAIVRLATSVLGLVDVEPFVLDDFTQHYSPHERVCFQIDGMTFNYREGYTERSGNRVPDRLQLIVGRCAACGERPNVLTIMRLSDVARALLGPDYASQRDPSWVCWRCEKRNSA